MSDIKLFKYTCSSSFREQRYTFSVFMSSLVCFSLVNDRLRLEVETSELLSSFEDGVSILELEFVLVFMLELELKQEAVVGIK